jgi:hypothetical protein
MEIHANTFHGLFGAFVMMILMGVLSQMCLKCQYEAKTYMLKEIKVLD